MADAKTMTWLPMSEAPRNQRIVAWNNAIKDWYVVYFDGHHWVETDGSTFKSDLQFTHWLPINPPH